MYYIAYNLIELFLQILGSSGLKMEVEVPVD